MRVIVFFFIALTHFTFAQKTDKYIKEKDVTRIISTLASDEMNGRSSSDEKSIFKAAAFIGKEFERIGLKPLPGMTSFLQEFSKDQILPGQAEVMLDGEKIDKDFFIVVTEKRDVNIHDNLAIKNIAVDNTV